MYARLQPPSGFSAASIIAAKLNGLNSVWGYQSGSEPTMFVSFNSYQVWVSFLKNFLFGVIWIDQMKNDSFTVHMDRSS